MRGIEEIAPFIFQLHKGQVAGSGGSLKWRRHFSLENFKNGAVNKLYIFQLIYTVSL